MPTEEEIDIEEFAKMTQGYTGAEVCMICREAGMNALSRDLMNGKVSKNDFLAALNKVLPRITKETLAYYDNFYKNRKAI
jgi:SpoVK/Ycf46/Vps4 family AAA+-type ATPase